MTEQECAIVEALRHYCFTGHQLPVWQWLFVKTMHSSSDITDKQGNYILRLADWHLGARRTP